MSIFLSLVFFVAAYGQEKSSVLEILAENDHPTGRATVVDLDNDSAYAVTAYHVVFDNPALVTNTNFKVRYKHDNIVRKGGRVLKGIKDTDLALIKIPIAPEVVPVEVGEIDDFEENQVIYYDINWVEHRPRLSLRQTKFYYWDFAPFQGESGGPVFYNGKLVGIVNGGWIIVEQDTFEVLKRRRQVWPMRTSKVPREFLKRDTPPPVILQSNPIFLIK